MILDTNALSAWAEGQSSIEEHLRSADYLVVPSIVLGEYYFGIRRSRFRQRYEAWLQANLPHTRIAQVGHATADVYAKIQEELRFSGTPIPSNDTWIAALARQHRLPLLSNDQHFDCVEGLERLKF